MLITLLFLSIVLQVNSQDNHIDKMQGYWIGEISSDPKSLMKFYELVRKNKKLSLIYESGKLIDVTKSIVGFTEIKKKPETISDLHESGIYLYDCTSEIGLLKNCTLIENFDVDSYWYGNADIYDFYKADSISINVIKDMLEWGKKIDNKDFLKSFMDIKIIKSKKSTIYTNISKPSKIYLLKGDIVEILQKKDQWIRIRYYGNKVVEGWVKNSDTDEF